MSHHDIKKMKKIMSCIIGIVILFIVMFSAFYISHEIEHECTGEDCPVCACIAQCENTLHQICEFIIPQIVTILIPLISIMSVNIFINILVFETPVSKKVRLDH